MPWIDNKYIFPRAAAANMQEIWPWPSPAVSPPPPPPSSINPLWRVKPQPAQSEGGDDFGATRPMPYNPEAILELDQSPWAKLGLLALPGGGFISAMNSIQAQNIRDDQMYSFLSDPSNRAESVLNMGPPISRAESVPGIGPAGPLGWYLGGSNTTDLGGDRSFADAVARGEELLATDLTEEALLDPDAPFSVAALDPSSYGMTDRDFEDPYPPGYDFEAPYSSSLGFGDLPGLLGDMYSGAKRGVTGLKDSMLGLLADADAPKSPDPLLMTDRAYAAAYGRANPRAGFSPATLAALAKQDAWAGGVAHGFGVGGPGDTSNMGVYGVDPTQPDGWGYLGTELEVQQNPNITQGPYGWGNYTGSSTGADYSGTPTGTSIVGPSNIYGGVNAGYEDDGGVSSGAAAAQEAAEAAMDQADADMGSYDYGGWGFGF